MLPVVGTVPTSKAAIYTVPKGVRAKITKIVVDNESGASRTVKLYVTVNGVEVGLSQTQTLADNEVMEDGDTIWLSEGASVSGEASGTVVRFFIAGEEVTL